jgi:hypothetical protein
MQNYYVKKLETIFAVHIKSTRKKLVVVYNFFVLYFQILHYNM